MLANLEATLYPIVCNINAYLANYILILNGYPPFMLYRAVFRWWRENCKDLDVFSESAFDEDAGHGCSYGKLMRKVNATWQLVNTPLDPTVFVSVIAKAVHCSCRRRLRVRGTGGGMIGVGRMTVLPADAADMFFKV